MLFVIFTLGNDRYAIDSRQVTEIIPMVPLKRFPKAPEYIAGVFRYRGIVVPVIDLSSLISGAACSRRLSTRIMLVSHRGADGREHPLGLMAERVVEAISASESDLVSPGIDIEAAPFLGKMICRGDVSTQEMIQSVNAEHLLPDSVRAMLFSDRKESDGLAQSH